MANVGRDFDALKMAAKKAENWLRRRSSTEGWLRPEAQTRADIIAADALRDALAREGNSRG